MKSFFEEYGHLLTLKYTPRLDYLSIIDKILTNNWYLNKIIL